MLIYNTKEKQPNLVIVQNALTRGQWPPFAFFYTLSSKNFFWSKLKRINVPKKVWILANPFFKMSQLKKMICVFFFNPLPPCKMFNSSNNKKAFQNLHKIWDLVSDGFPQLQPYIYKSC